MSNYVRDLPDKLISLVRHVLRSFYEFELYLVMDMLIHYPCIREDQLADILKLDGKKVRQYLIALKAEKFVSEKLTIETSNDNKQNKVIYYYINYKMMVNVIKYKLDHMRKQIVDSEQKATIIDSYKCSHCGRHYTALDIVNILPSMKCEICEIGIVDEDQSLIPRSQSRNLIANYNEQIKPIFELLKQIEHIQLPQHILSPIPADYKYVIDGSNTLSSAERHQVILNRINGSNHVWSGDKTRNNDIMSQASVSVMIDNNEREMSINDRIEQSILSKNLNTSQDMVDSLIPNNSLSAINNFIDKCKNNKQVDNIQSQTSTPLSNSTRHEEELIMDLLIKYENKSCAQNKKLNGSIDYGVNGCKKRDYNQTTSDELAAITIMGSSNSDEDDINNNIPKKRKLNGFYAENTDELSFYNDSELYIKNGFHNGNHLNGLFNHHNGNDQDDLMDIDSENENSLHFLKNGNGHHHHHHHEMTNGHYNDNEFLIKIQHDYIPIENITPDLIIKMNKQEKQIYIDKCRQLYTAMIE